MESENLNERKITFTIAAKTDVLEDEDTYLAIVSYISSKIADSYFKDFSNNKEFDYKEVSTKLYENLPKEVMSGNEEILTGIFLSAYIAAARTVELMQENKK